MKKVSAFCGLAAATLAYTSAPALDLNLGGGGSISISPPSADVDVRPPSVDIQIDINPPAPMAPAVADPGQAIFALPVALTPQLPCGAADSGHCVRDTSEREALFTQAMTAAVAGVPTAVVAACREGIINAAKPYDPVQIEVVGAGSVQELKAGGQIAPLVVRIVYDSQGGYETREARVGCHVNALGKAVSLT